MRTSKRKVMLSEIEGLLNIVTKDCDVHNMCLSINLINIARVAAKPRLPLRDVAVIRDFLVLITDSLLDSVEDPRRTMAWELFPYSFK